MTRSVNRSHCRHAGLMACLLLPFSAQAATYLKADATGTGDGSNWTNACTTFAAAFSAAKAGDNIIYAARGVYTIAATPTATDGFRLYGGFRGDETGTPEEMLAARDTEQYQTIFTSDKGTRNFQWVHVGPGAAGSFTWSEIGKLDKTAYPALTGGTFTPPPATTGDFDCYYLLAADKYTSSALTVNQNIDVTVDGIWYIGMSGGISIQAAHTNEAVTRHITDCRFIGSPGVVMANANFGVTTATPAVLVERCQHLHFQGGCVVRGYGRRLRIQDCTFSHLVRPAGGADRGSAVIYCWGGGYVDVIGCTFSRALFVTSSGSEGMATYPPANCISWEAVSAINVTGCVFTNNLSYSQYGYGCTLVGVKNGRIEGSYFANNRLEVKPIATRPYSLVVVSPGYSTLSSYVSGCTFESNTVAVTALGLTGGTYACGMIGTGTGKILQSIYNCTFADNGFETVAADGVTPILSQGVLFAENVATLAGSRCGIANCTFTRSAAAADIYDVAQFSPLHNSAFPVLNCVFTRGGDSDYNPFYADVPALLAVRNSSVAGLSTPPAGILFAGLEADPVPLAREAAADGRNVVFRPAANMPALRETADIASNSESEYIRTYRYRLPGETTWKVLLAGETLNGAAAVPLEDACGTMRAFGAYTRGAVQALAEATESGRTLLLRSDPVKLAVFTGAPWWQVVPTNGTMTPVTVSGLHGATFSRWVDTNGVTISTSATLSGLVLTNDITIITAVLSPATVTLSFNLGLYGVFTDDGTSYKDLECAIGAEMPQLLVTDAAEYHFEGWAGGLPSKVPSVDTTYVATGVSKNLRVVYLVPADDPALATGNQDGTSWDDAYGSLIDAVNDARRWRGEVRVKRGVYGIDASIPSFSNVRIRGGWAGTEGAEGAPDPAANPTIMTGDQNRDNYWRPNNADPGVAYRTNIWDYATLTFNMPTPRFETYWAATGNSGDNTPAFISDHGSVTNCQIEGLAITGFKNTAISIVVSSTMDFSNCRFLANNTSMTEGTTGGALLVTGNASFDACDFIGSHTPLAFYNTESAYKGTNRVTASRFLYNHGNGSGTGGGLIVYTAYKDFVLSGCRFAHNFVWEYQGYQRCPVQFDSVKNLTISDTVVEDNVAKNRCVSVFDIETVAETLRISRCIFRRNTKIGHGTDSGATAGTLRIAGASLTRQAVVEDCLFDENAVIRQNESNSSSSTKVCEQAAGVNVRYGRVALVNCTFNNNSTDTTGAPSLATGASGDPLAGTIIAAGANAHLALVNCALGGNTVVGPIAAEISTRSTVASTALAVLNSALWNGAPDYVPFIIQSAAQPLGAANSAIRNIEASVCAATSYWFSVWSADPLFKRVVSASDDARAMLKVRASLYARASRPVWAAEDGFLYFYDSVTDPAKPWRRVTENASFSAAAPAGVTLTSAPIPDAFGAARNIKGFTLGPVDGGPRNTLLMLR